MDAEGAIRLPHLDGETVAGRNEGQGGAAAALLECEIAANAVQRLRLPVGVREEELQLLAGRRLREGQLQMPLAGHADLSAVERTVVVKHRPLPGLDLEARGRRSGGAAHHRHKGHAPVGSVRIWGLPVVRGRESSPPGRRPVR